MVLFYRGDCTALTQHGNAAMEMLQSQDLQLVFFLTSRIHTINALLFVGPALPFNAPLTKKDAISAQADHLQPH